jgi:phosphatidylglycerol:prolipoprotein diacylglycerol transferase
VRHRRRPLGYALFYKPAEYLAHPLEILMVWKGGMSFHGGLLGVMVAMAVFARGGAAFLAGDGRRRPVRAHGLAAGRIGNFINGELWGRAADPSLPWAMVFPQSGSMVPRHPSQIYQFLLEGLLLFVLLWWYARRERATGQVAAAFAVGYGVLRFIAEYFREPDAFLGTAGAGHEHGPVAVCADDRLWCRAVVVGRAQQGTIRA